MDESDLQNDQRPESKSKFGSAKKILNDEARSKRKELRIISLNIENLAKKSRDIELQEMLKETDIVGFCETWLEKSKQIQIPGFSMVGCIHATRRAKRGRFCGGIAVYCRESIRSLIQLIPQCSGSNNIWIRLLASATPIRICFVYRQPEGAALSQNDFYDQLESESEKLDEHHGPEPCIILGDHNARIKDYNSSDITHGSDISNFVEVNGTELTRVSKDKSINKYGKELLKFVDKNNLNVLNGAWIGDEKGEFTFIGAQGSSVIDYGVVCDMATPLVNKFEVLPMAISSHLPIRLSLDLNCDDISNVANSQDQVSLTPILVNPLLDDEETANNIGSKSNSLAPFFTQGIKHTLESREKTPLHVDPVITTLRPKQIP